MHLVRDKDQVIDSRGMPERIEGLASHAVAAFGSIAEREQRFVTTGCGPFGGSGDGLLDGHIRRRQLPRLVRKRAIVAHVPTQLRQGNENLG